MSGIQQVVFFAAYFLVWVVVVSIVLTLGPGWKQRALVSLVLAGVAVLLILNGIFLVASALPLLLLLGANWKRRALYGLPVWFLFALYPAYWFGMEEYYRYLARRDYAYFQELCKQAEETIYRRVENVDGIMRMRLYKEYVPKSEEGVAWGSHADQYGLENPYGHVSFEPLAGPDLIIHPLKDAQFPPRYQFLEEVLEVGAPVRPPLRRYWSVETNERIGARFPRSSRAKESFRRVESMIVSERKAKYGYTWRDLTTDEMRERWIAGAEYKIVDLDTGDVLARKVGYIFARQYPDGHLDRTTWDRGGFQRCSEDKTLVFPFILDVLRPSKSKTG